MPADIHDKPDPSAEASRAEDAAANVAQTPDSAFTASGQFPGGSWTTTLDPRGVDSVNDDGRNFQFEFDAQRINAPAPSRGEAKSDLPAADHPPTGQPVKTEAPAAERQPATPGGLTGVEQRVDAIVNPSAAEHPLLRGALDNLAGRGQGVVEGIRHGADQRLQVLSALSEGRVGDAASLGAKQIGDTVTGMATGLGHSVATLGNALGDLAYYGSHPAVPGAEQKIGSALVDGVLESATVVTALDGAAGIAKGGEAALGKSALGDAQALEGVSPEEAGLKPPEHDAQGAAGGAPPESPPPEAPPSDSGGPSDTNTEQIFSELKEELASVSEAEGPLAPGHHGPGIGGLSESPAPVKPYGAEKRGGHHIHQGAAFTPVGTEARAGSNYSDAATVNLSKAEHTNVHRVTDAVNRNLHGATINKDVGTVEIRATGDGTRAAIGDPPAQPWSGDVTAYYGLRASGSPIYGTAQGALDAVIQSDTQLNTVGAHPVKVPKR